MFVAREVLDGCKSGSGYSLLLSILALIRAAWRGGPGALMFVEALRTAPLRMSQVCWPPNHRHQSTARAPTGLRVARVRGKAGRGTSSSVDVSIIRVNNSQN